MSQSIMTLAQLETHIEEVESALPTEQSRLDNAVENWNATRLAQFVVLKQLLWTLLMKEIFFVF